MTAAHRAGGETAVRAGHTRITRAALTHAAEAVTAAALGVPRREVRVTLSDDDGALGVSVAAPIPAPTLQQAAQQHSGGTLYERADQARATIRTTVTQVTGSVVGRIDITLTGIRPPAERALA